ncbi:MAG: type IV toxin-antitoxin system AbiEi family antitoxin domain-containing protein [Pirellulales bacterium]
MKPDHFLASHSLFTREELRAALAGRNPATLDAHLARWRQQGRIVRVKNGLYLRRGPEGAGAHLAAPDFIALAARMAPDAAAAYHTALEAHGCAQSLFEQLTFVTWTRTKPVTFMGRRLAPVRPRAPLNERDGGEAWIETMDRAGLEVRITSLERTAADVLDRPSLAGGIGEVWRSLFALPAIDPEALLDYVRALCNRTVAARVGFFLEKRRDELAVPTSVLEELRALLPNHPVHLDRALGGRLNSRWRLIVPEELVNAHEEGAA